LKLHNGIPAICLGGLVAQRLGHPQQKLKQRWRVQVMRDACHDGVREKHCGQPVEVIVVVIFCPF
jgi:hypothetical protein